jgi:hypothetical protein
LYTANHIPNWNNIVFVAEDFGDDAFGGGGYFAVYLIGGNVE